MMELEVWANTAYILHSNSKLIALRLSNCLNSLNASPYCTIPYYENETDSKCGIVFLSVLINYTE